ncbi:COP9 signalosome complex subunit 3 [Penicillium argentinense]|uniref:COP9 signalosome complex subunit 3 n=1 Tax=Penicillium argentinense TaxID=1131581 RepID=A0A9W9FMG7_9EURO|nr:COP9 signalosome complex subunit 3 [Penicillium argentinense]KAJ5102874.1 COP9 signalosome complex subunit 3 [Penicillium argentinense]
MDSISALISKSEELRISARRSDEEYDRCIRDHVASVRQSLSSKTLDLIATDHTLLDHFDPATDSITYLLLLLLRIQTLQQKTQETLPGDLLPSGDLWPKCTRYLKTFDPIQLLKLLSRQDFPTPYLKVDSLSCADSPQPLLAVPLIRDAMLKLDPSGAVFTSMHLLFVRLCLRARAYSYSLPILEKHICHFPGPAERVSSKSSPVLCAEHESSLAFINASSGLSSPLSCSDYLQYFLFGGMIYLALKEWAKASHFLEVVISMPTNGPISMVMVVAYKKWLLVGLLEAGKLRSPPSVVAPHVVRIYQSLARPYVNFAQAFEHGDLGRLDAEVGAAEDIWRKDNNMGLVSQVMNSFSRHALVGVGETFAALTIADLIGQSSSLPCDKVAAESVIASLIISGALDATLVQTPGHSDAAMLRFSGMPRLCPSSHELRLQTMFTKERGSLEGLMMAARENIHKLGVSPEFVDHVHKGQVWAGAGEAHLGIGDDAGLEIDEDIMGDMP